MDWTPSAKFSVSAGWMLENVQDSANYRYRTGAVGSVTFDNVSYRWMNTNKDKNTTMFANANANLIPDKLDLVGTWSLIDSHWQMFNVNPDLRRRAEPPRRTSPPRRRIGPRSASAWSRCRSVCGIAIRPIGR